MLTDFAQARAGMLLIGILVLGSTMFLFPDGGKIFSADWIKTNFISLIYLGVGIVWGGITARNLIKGHRLLCSARKSILLII